MLWINWVDIYNNLLKAGLTGKWSQKLLYLKYVFMSRIDESEKTGSYNDLCFVLFMWCMGEDFEIGNPSKSIKVPCSATIFHIKYRLLFIFCSFHPFHQKINSFNQQQLNAVCFFYLHHRELYLLEHCKLFMKGFRKIISF